MASLTDLLYSGEDILDYLVKVRENTVKKDQKLLTHALLAMFSAYISEPINLDVQAPSSEGKTYTVTQVAELFPEGDVWQLIGATPKSFIHDKGMLVDKDTLEPVEPRLLELRKMFDNAKDKEEKKQIKEEIRQLLENTVYLVDLENRILIFLDSPRLETINMLKPVLSHDTYEYVYKYTDKDSKGRLRTKTVVLKGWPVVIIIRVKGETNEADYTQISSRFILVSPNMSKEKYREAIKLLALRMGLPGVIVQKRLALEEVSKAKLLVKTVKERLVQIRDKARQKTGNPKASMFWIPYWKKIAEIFPAYEGRHMRDANKFFTLLQLIAAVNVYSRPILEIDGVEYIIVTKKDFDKAYELFLSDEDKLEIFAGIPKHVAEFFKKVLVPLWEENGPIHVNDLVEEMPKRLGVYKDSSTIRKNYLKRLAAAGFISIEPDPEDRRRNIIKVLRTSLDETEWGNSRSILRSHILEMDELKREFSELIEKKDPYNIKIKDFDGRILSIEELWKKYFSYDENGDVENGNASHILLRSDKNDIDEKSSKLRDLYIDHEIPRNFGKTENSLGFSVNQNTESILCSKCFFYKNHICTLYIERVDNGCRMFLDKHLASTILRLFDNKPFISREELSRMEFIDYKREEVERALNILIETRYLEIDSDGNIRRKDPLEDIDLKIIERLEKANNYR